MLKLNKTHENINQDAESPFLKDGSYPSPAVHDSYGLKVQSEVLTRLNRRLKGTSTQDRSISSSEHNNIQDNPSVSIGLDSHRQNSLLIKDRSGNGLDHYYQPNRPENVLYVQDATFEKNMSQEGRSRGYYLTNSGTLANGKKKITLNLRVTKTRLQELKNIRTLIRVKDPHTHAIVAKEKLFDISALNSSANNTGATRDRHLKKQLVFKHNGGFSVLFKSVNRSLNRSLNRVSEHNSFIRGSHPVVLEKVQFSHIRENEELKKPLSKRRSSDGFIEGQATFDQHRGLYFVLIGDMKCELVNSLLRSGL